MTKILSILYILFFYILLSCKPDYISNSEELKREAKIFPDYTNLVIPANIAPLNFIINEEGNKFVAMFSGNTNKGFKIVSNTPSIIIPQKKWASLLSNNIEKKIDIKIFVKNQNNKWTSYKEFSDSIVTDKIDPYFVYRRINTAMIFWDNMSIVQRSLEGFEENDIVNNKNLKNGCVHCHSFRSNDPKSMLLHFRAGPSGTYIKSLDKTLWLNTKTPYTLASFVYPAWHPNGKLIAFSTNKISQSFYGSGHRLSYIRDAASDIVIYDIEANMVFTSPEIATLNCENLPEWSPDGKFLYFTRCPQKSKILSDTLTKYDLLRISFDEKTQKFGKAEIILASSDTKNSISFPAVSPDGKFLIFCMADYGYFTITNPTSDLYIMDLGTFKYRKLVLNSNYTESFHSWSSNGRWLVFASKRIDGVITMPFFSFINSAGYASKPFVLPTKDPATIKTRLFNYNRPVFVTGKIELDQNELLKQVQKEPKNVWFDTLNVELDALAGATIRKEKDEQNDVPYKKN
jgi:hypothetical protein